MVWRSIKRAVGLEEPSLPEGPTRLPKYFPVEPKGCEKHSQKLFSCLFNEATEKARDMERAGVNSPYFKGVSAKPTDPQAAKAVSENPENPEYPRAGDNPLDECRTLIAYYKQCCDKKLKQRRNILLTEHVRVQEEYRYKGLTEDPPLAKNRKA
eukprot:CAMPEP_0176023582 /NCGR_PEP_ID=MMETSP0120_2-20121206/11508_1 /TAXON_ID=160619 /ORGANISM="Kryptoperidinium foliaceum, Strain CCMP 1326" /LENGTH=153 /DNA_ID=CAMNT_0017356749 /DNA_START=144 /DNA_END=605 /DNA_ORIENTATION=-